MQPSSLPALLLPLFLTPSPVVSATRAPISAVLGTSTPPAATAPQAQGGAQEAAAAQTEAVPKSEPAVVRAQRRDVERSIELSGRLQAAGAHELALWPDAYMGPFLFIEVTPHGSYLNAGDLIARFESREYRERVADAERALVTARIAQGAAEERARLSEEEEQEARLDAQRAVERARLALEGWSQHELDLARRGDELSAQYTQHNIDDQVDELKQLEAMYSDDELVEATEEIVLARSRRDLARSRFAQKMSEDRRQYEASYQRPQTTQDRERAVERAEASLARLAVRQAVTRRERADSLERSGVEVEKQRRSLERLRADERLFELVAPSSCVLLHGGLADYAPGGKRPTHERGGSAALRSALFTIADPEQLAVAVTLDQAQRSGLEPRSGVRVRVEGRELELVGTLALESYPEADGKFRGLVSLPRVPSGLVAGLSATVAVRAETLADALVLPRAAVSGEGTAAHCWTLDAGTGEFRRTPLELGQVDGDEVVVKGGLEAGAQVLLTGSAQ